MSENIRQLNQSIVQEASTASSCSSPKIIDDCKKEKLSTCNSQFSTLKNKPLIALLTNNDDDVFCFRLELIQAFLKEGYSLLISCPDGPKFEVMEEDYDLKKGRDFIYDNPDIDRRGTSLLNDAKLAVHYLKLFKKYKPSVVLTYTAKPNVYACIAAQLLNIPYIPNVTGLGSILNKPELFQRFFMFLYKTAFKKANCIMFQNPNNYELARKHRVITSDYKIIPGSGVSLERFPVQPYPDGDDGIKGETVVFNYIGRVLKEKGIDDFIEAAKIIKRKYPKTEFNVIGFIEPTEQHYKNEVKELEKKGIVYYRGSQKDVRPFIKRSHCIIHPSLYGEGISNVLLENASSGRPIITTDNTGCVETVTNGVSGFIYHGNNINELVETIEKFLSMKNENRKEMGLAGRAKVEKEFDRKNVIQAYKTRINMLVGLSIK